MPSRWLCWVIVGSWLATTGWLFWHDLRPLFFPGEPPMFQIDIVEEVHKSEKSHKTYWNVERQVKKQAKPELVFRAATWVDREKDDVYSLIAELDGTKDPQFQPVSIATMFRIKRMTSAYRVTRWGQLHSLKATVTVQFDWELPRLLRRFGAQPDLFPTGPTTEPISLSIWGDVRERQLFTHFNATMKSQSKPLMQFDLPPAAVSYSGSVLMPLHPVSHIRGLRLGQSWRQPLVDPLSDSFSLLSGISGSMRWLNARVLPQQEMLELNGSKTTCLVIVYTDNEEQTVGRTWVEEDGERVLQQEAILEDSRWIMKRESTRRSGVGFLGS
jgi:hypothetical protein